ncbi:transcriptional regulator LrhA, partial [Vibrio parahaemolyticus]|nr:transcriptional regulator LrhA [Vibrio parahaemolyticus]
VLWHSAPDFQLRPNEPIPLVDAGLSWHVAYEAASLPAVRAAVNAEVGVTARPMEMQNADLRILNEADGLPRLPDIQYWLYKNADEQKDFVLTVFGAIENKKIPYVAASASELMDSNEESN